MFSKFKSKRSWITITQPNHK